MNAGYSGREGGGGEGKEIREMGEGVNACVRERETMEGGGVGGQGESSRQEFARGRSRHFAFYPVINSLAFVAATVP